jgi:arsenate reductase
MSVTIYHNSDCGTSRNTLALIRRAGIEPTIIEYRRTPPDRATLTDLLERAGLSPRDAAREKGTPFKDLGLDDPAVGDDAFIDAMLVDPILINRPIVVTPKGVNLCRPSDVVLDLLPPLPAKDIAKEDGEPVLVDEEIAAGDAAFVVALGAADLPTDDLPDPGQRFFAYTTLGGHLVGYGGYELLGRDALIRSIVVDPAWRGRLVGRSLVLLLLRRAFDQGARHAWLLTTSAARYFEKLGFEHAQRADAPAIVMATRQAAFVCPSSAALLTRRISL